MTVLRPPTLVPVVARRPVGVAVGLAAALFAVLAVKLAGTSTPVRLDRSVDHVVDPVGNDHVRLVGALMDVGSPPSVLALSFLLAGVCLLLGRRRLAVLAVVGPGLTGVCTTLLKPALGVLPGQVG